MKICIFILFFFLHLLGPSSLIYLPAQLAIWSLLPLWINLSSTGSGHASVTSVAFESKDDPTQMTKIVIYNYILYYIQKTIHFKLICTNVHS